MTEPAVFRVALVPNAGVFHLNTSENGEIKVVGGYEAILLEILSQGLKASLKIMVPEDKEWGRRKKTGKWTGMIGMLEKDEADLAVGWMSITEERLKVADFSYPYSKEEVTFATQQPSLLPRTAALIQPLYSQVWILISLLLIVPLMFRLILGKKHSLSKLFLAVFGSLVRQSFGVPVGRSFKEMVLFLAWILTAMFTSSAYTAVLLAYLYVPLQDEGINNIDQLHEAVVVKQNYECAVFKGSIIAETLRYSENEKFQSIGKWLSQNYWFIESDPEISINYILQGKRALIAPRANLQDELQNIGYISSDTFYTGLLAIAANKRINIKDRLYEVIRALGEAGLYEKGLNDKRYYDNQKHKKYLLGETKGVPKQLSINDLLGLFAIFASGLGLSFVVFIIEILWNRLK